MDLTRIRLFAALLAWLFVAILPATVVQSSPLDYREFSPTEILLAQRSIADSTAEPAPQPSMAPPPSPVADPPASTPPPVPPTKSSGRAFLYNLVIPGTGHLYAGYKRGWAHIGMEGLTWVTYFYYHDRGETKEQQFESFADQHWDYDAWLAACGCAGTPPDSIIVDFHENNEQQYYEDIGKLPVYYPGWDDYDANTGLPPFGDSANRRYYRGIRNDSNNFFKNARYALVFGFVNRIVSAVDVLRLVKKTKPVVALSDETTLSFKMRAKPFNRENAFGVRLTTKI